MSHVDWITVVGRREAEGADWTVHSAYDTATAWLEDMYPSFGEDIGRPRDWQIVKPRAPYSYARRSDDCTRTLYVHPLSTHFTLEISGQHCQLMGTRVFPFMEAFAAFLSRLDIATDMQTDVTPLEFDSQCDPERISTRSRMESQTGQTVYIGSRSSERFCRVYRYNAPHPRAHLLRAEFQLKGEYAKTAGMLIGSGVVPEQLAADLGNEFGFHHPVWKPDSQPVSVKVKSHAQSGHTVYWLNTTVAPLLKRLQREGKLDIAAWFDEYVLKE